MATSLVDLDQKSFWSPDTLLEILASLLADELRRTNPVGWARSYSDHLHTQATAGVIGCIDLRLNSLSAAARGEFLLALERARQRIEGTPDLLSAAELNRRNLSGGAHFGADVAPNHVVALIEVMARLIRGEWQWVAEDPEALPLHWLSPRHGSPSQTPGDPDDDPDR